MPRPAVLEYPKAGDQLKRGFDLLADALALTLGPKQGVVYSQTDGAPELLSDAATIARRVMQLPRRSQDVGAMLLRNLVWRMHLRAGDGSATAAVLARALLDEAFRYRAAGANVMELRRGMAVAASAALAALDKMARPVGGEEDLIGLAETATADPDLSIILGEIFDLLGPDAHVTVEDYVAPYLEREYHEGGRWQGRLASLYLITDPARSRAVQASCRVALCAGPVTDPAAVQALLEVAAASEAQPQPLALIAYEIGGEALASLVVNHRQGRLKVIAVELRRPESRRRLDLEDLAVLTGATVLGPETGRSLNRVRVEDLGSARRVEADAGEMVVAGGEGRADRVRAQIAILRAQLDAEDGSDAEAEAELRLRLARLSGSMVTLKVGASTRLERQALRQRAEKGLRALPVALREGIVPGGGTAYLACIPAVRELELEGEVAWGADIVARALEAPFRQIALNAGVAAPAVLLAEATRCGAGFGYDALKGQVVSMEEAGILDAAGVLRQALQTAVSGASMALTTEVMVLKRTPRTSLEP